MSKLFRLLAPLASSVTLRLVQLLVMVVGSRLIEEDTRPSFIAAFSIIAAFGVFSDSGAATFLLATTNVSRRALAIALRTQVILSATGAAAAITFSLLTLPWGHISNGLLIAGALAATQSLDSITRVARSVRLRAGDDLGFAAGDGLSAAAKLAAVGVGLITGSIYFIILLPVASLGVLCLMLAWTRRSPLADETSAPRTRDVLQYGVAGALSGLYSQTPFLLATWFLPVEAVAVLSVMLRVIQPLEIAPAVASQQLMPRVRGMHPRSWSIWWAAFAGSGLALGATIVIARMPLEITFNQPLSPTLVVVLVASTVLPKFGNYFLSALALALGEVRSKIRVSLVVGIFAIVSSVALLPIAGSAGAAISMLASEIILTIGLVFVIRAAQRRTS